MRPIYHRPHRTSVALRRAEPRVRRLDARSRLAGVEFLGVCRRKRLQVRCSRPGITRGLAALGPSRFGLSPAPARSETHCSSPSCNGSRRFSIRGPQRPGAPHLPRPYLHPIMAPIWRCDAVIVSAHGGTDPLMVRSTTTCRLRQYALRSARWSLRIQHRPESAHGRRERTVSLLRKHVRADATRD